MSARIAQVIVEVEPDHLDRPFDYRVPDDVELGVGSRVEVVFSGRRLRGLVVGVSEETDVPDSRLRDIRRLLGEHAWMTEEEIGVLRWAAERFAAPVAAVVRHALPGRVVDVERRAADAGWFPPGVGEQPRDPEPQAVEEGAWAVYGAAGAALLAAVRAGAAASDRADVAAARYWRPLPGEDLGARLVELIGSTLESGRDALVVVPEPVSQAADTVISAFGDLVVDVRGDRGTRATYSAWLRARCGQARVLVGERGVAFWPLPRLGLGIVVDESSPALKERRAPRHHAREVVLERCRRAGAVAVLVGHVPSAVAWRLLAERRLVPVVPRRESERAAAPVVHLDDRRDPRSKGRLGTLALRALRAAVEDGTLGVVLAARRGEGRVLVCSSCGRIVTCPRCDSTLARVADGSACERCGWSASGLSCVECDGDAFAPLAAGAQRFGDELARTFAGTEVAVLEGYAQPAPQPPAIVVMTRGSAQWDPPGQVGAVVLPDLDRLLRRPALDAAEDALRVAMRVAGWTATDGAVAGDVPVRGGGSGRVVVALTRDPTHHAAQALVRWDPGGFWRAEVERRAELRFPPVAHAIRLDIGGDGRRVVTDLRAVLDENDDVLGPRPDGDRSGVLLKVTDRTAALATLAPLRAAWSEDGLDVRVDVDPVDVA